MRFSIHIEAAGEIEVRGLEDITPDQYGNTLQQISYYQGKRKEWNVEKDIELVIRMHAGGHYSCQFCGMTAEVDELWVLLNPYTSRYVHVECFLDVHAGNVWAMKVVKGHGSGDERCTWCDRFIHIWQEMITVISSHEGQTFPNWYHHKCFMAHDSRKDRLWVMAMAQYATQLVEEKEKK
jgi:hypothetical protein